MPLSFRQAGNLFVAGPNINIYPSGNNYAISGSASGSTVGIESITTVGSGAFSIASSVTNKNLVYDSLSGTAGFGITDNGAGRLLFTSATPNVVLSGRNIGTGVGVFSAITTTISQDDTLGFYSFSGTNQGYINIDSQTGEIEIGRGRIIANLIGNQGLGARIYSGISRDRLICRTILGATAAGSGFSATISGAGNANVVIRPFTTFGTTPNRFAIIEPTSPVSIGLSSSILPSAVTRNMGIGVANTPRTSLLIATGAAAVSQIRLTAFGTEPTNPDNGSVWFSTLGNTLKFEKDTVATDFIFKDNNNSLTSATNSILAVNTAGTIIQKYTNSFGVFNALSSVTIENTASQTSIISSILTGSTTLFASTNAYNPELVVGRKFRFNAKGIISSDAITNLTINLKLGGTTIGTTSSFTIIEGLADNYFEIDYTFTVRNNNIIVGSGKIFSDTQINSASSEYFVGIYSQNATVTTTQNLVFDVVALFDVADSNNILTINESTLEILN
jgi:hypothetical protein